MRLRVPGGQSGSSNISSRCARQSAAVILPSQTIVIRPWALSSRYAMPTRSSVPSADGVASTDLSADTDRDPPSMRRDSDHRRRRRRGGRWTGPNFDRRGDADDAVGRGRRRRRSAKSSSASNWRENAALRQRISAELGTTRQRRLRPAHRPRAGARCSSTGSSTACSAASARRSSTPCSIAISTASSS